MNKTNLAVLLIALLLPRQIAPGSQGEQSRGTNQTRAAKACLPFVVVSSVTVEPKEIHQASKPREAVISVQIFHLTLSAPQTVRMNVGTFSTEPVLGVTASYSPASQTVKLPAGNSGPVTAKAEVRDVRIGTNKQAKLVIAATVTNPSPGIRVEPSPLPDNWRTTLTVKNP